MKLIELIHKTSAFGFVLSLNQNEYNDFIVEASSKKPLNSYTFLISQALRICSDWAIKNTLDERIEYFFEAGDSNQMAADKTLTSHFRSPQHRQQLNYANHEFVKKNDVGALACQAADLLSYLGSHSAVNASKNKGARKDMDALFRQNVDVFYSFNSRELLKFFNLKNNFDCCIISFDGQKGL